MYISHIVKDFLITVKEQLPEYNYLKKDFYDPSLDFDNRIRSYLVKVDNEELNGSDVDWLGICWNRSGIQDAPEVQGRSFQAISKNFTTETGDLYSVKLAKVNFSIAYFSNSFDYMEDFEENHYLVFNKLFSHKVLLPVFGWTDIAFTEISLSDPNKLDRNDKGTIVELPLSFTAIFPVARLIEGGKNKPLIGESLDPITGLPTGKPKVNVSLHFEIV